MSPLSVTWPSAPLSNSRLPTWRPMTMSRLSKVSCTDGYLHFVDNMYTHRLLWHPSLGELWKINYFTVCGLYVLAKYNMRNELLSTLNSRPTHHAWLLTSALPWRHCAVRSLLWLRHKIITTVYIALTLCSIEITEMNRTETQGEVKKSNSLRRRWFINL